MVLAERGSGWEQQAASSPGPLQEAVTQLMLVSVSKHAGPVAGKTGASSKAPVLPLRPRSQVSLHARGRHGLPVESAGDPDKRPGTWTGHGAHVTGSRAFGAPVASANSRPNPSRLPLSRLMGGRVAFRNRLPGPCPSPGLPLKGSFVVTSAPAKSARCHGDIVPAAFPQEFCGLGCQGQSCNQGRSQPSSEVTAS